MIELNFLPETLRPTAVKLSSNIDFAKVVSKGGNGYVLIGKNTLLNRDVVVKFYYWGGGDHAEPALLASLECEQILKVLHAEKIDEDEAFFMTPFCERGDLDDALEARPFGPLEALDVLLEVAAGVSYLHSRRFLHRDLKLSNVFCLTDNRFVIGDFGSVVPQDDQGCAKTLTRHSLPYRPPEEINTKTICRQSDIYQLGLLFYQILGGYLPYDEYDWLSTKEKTKYMTLSEVERQFYAAEIIESKICRGKLVDMSKLPAWVPFSLKAVVRKCVSVEISRRYDTVADLTAKLNNIRKYIPDWRIGQYPILIRKNKSIRINTAGNVPLIEKNVGGTWRVERRHLPQSISDAVAIAETL